MIGLQIRIWLTCTIQSIKSLEHLESGTRRTSNERGPAQDQPARMINAIKEIMNSGSQDSIFTAAQYKVFTAN